MSKYHARKTPCQHGHVHDSAREAKRCAELHVLLRAGTIDGLMVQPKYELAPGGHALRMGNGHKAHYTPDFAYLERGNTVVEDVKGFIVRDFPLRAALFRHCYPNIELRVVK